MIGDMKKNIPSTLLMVLIDTLWLDTSATIHTSVINFEENSYIYIERDLNVRSQNFDDFNFIIKFRAFVCIRCICVVKGLNKYEQILPCDYTSILKKIAWIKSILCF